MKNEKKLIYIIFIFCILSLLPFFIISFYSRPSADDFDYSYILYNLIKNGNYNVFSLLRESFKVMVSIYNSWQGTYSSAIIMSLQTGIWGDKYYFLGTFILITFMYVCLYRFFSVINKTIINNYISTWFISLLFLTIILQTTPDICQCLYWQCGAYHYVPFFFLDLVMISYIIDYFYEKEKKERIKYLVISSVISFIISGGNQVTSFINILILCIAIAYAIVFKRNKGLILPLVFSIIGFIIMFIAPGNAFRINANVQTNIFIAILNSFKGTIKYAYRWFSLAWVSFIALIIIIFVPFINEYKKELLIHPFFILTISFLLYAAMFCPTNYAISSNGPGRLKNIIYYSCIFFSVFDVIYILIWIKNKYNVKYYDNYKVSRVFILALSIVFCFSINNNVTIITKELTCGIAENFAKSYDDRIKIINESNLEIVVVDKLKESKVLKFDDITSDINDWRNISWSKYYGIKTITKE